MRRRSFLELAALAATSGVNGFSRGNGQSGVSSGPGTKLSPSSRVIDEVCAQKYQIRNRSCAVIFNDAVALDLDPSTEKELSLIDAAAVTVTFPQPDMACIVRA